MNFLDVPISVPKGVTSVDRVGKHVDGFRFGLRTFFWRVARLRILAARLAV